MLFRQRFLDGIRKGTVTLAFRRWRRPSVRAGSTLLTAARQLAIVSIEEVTMTAISDADARRAGYATRAELVTELRARAEGKLYRIELGALISIGSRILMVLEADVTGTSRRSWYVTASDDGGLTWNAP